MQRFSHGWSHPVRLVAAGRRATGTERAPQTL